MTQDHLPTSPSLRFQTVQRSENRRRLDNHVLPKSSSDSGPGRSTRVWRPNGLMMIELATQHFHCANPIDHDQIEAAPSPNPARTSMAIAKKAAKSVKKAARAKATPQTTVTLKHLAAALSDSHDMPKKQAEAVLGDLVTLTTRHLRKGDKIRLSGLGILQVRKRAARMGRNPATGEAIKIKASKKVAFRVAKELKEAV
jgi:DNA-binding protein HU-beta